MKQQKRNILISCLTSLNVRFTSSFVCKLHEEHPYKNTLYEISDILSMYRIKTKGIIIKEKEIFDLNLLERPFIAQIEKSLVNVINIKDSNIIYILNGSYSQLTVSEFIKQWTGALLIIIDKENAKEPDYEKNFKESFFKKNSLYGLFILFLLFSSYTYIQNEIYFSFMNNIFLLLNIGGICVTSILLLNQLNINTSRAQKLCSLLKGNHCEKVLESSASKLGGVISWSDIGLGYFISNFSLLIFFPHLYVYSVSINLLILPYTIWSIWYQKFRVKQWCTLCLITLLILWSIFIINLISGQILLPDFLFSDILILISIYVLPLLIIYLFTSYISIVKENENITYKLNYLKANKEVFTALQKIKPYYEINDSISHIIFGNPVAKNRITIITNPHCIPCAIMHNRISRLLYTHSDKICVQYIFSSFTKEIEFSTRFLIATFQNKSKEEAEYTYNKWFNSTKYERNIFLKNNDLNINASDIEKELRKHEDWCKKNKIHTTPLVLINGYKLDDNYMIEDIRHFSF